MVNDYLCGLSLSDISSKTNIATGSLWNIVQGFAQTLKSDEEVAQGLGLKDKNRWSGILLLDGKVVRTHEGNFTLLLAFDFGTCDLISSVFSKYESEAVLVELVNQVLSWGYSVRFLVTDAKQAMINLSQSKLNVRSFFFKGSRKYPRPFYGYGQNQKVGIEERNGLMGVNKPLLLGTPHQLCVVHLLRDVDAALKYPRTKDEGRIELRFLLHRILMAKRYAIHKTNLKRLFNRFPLTGKEQIKAANIVLSHLPLITTHFRFRRDNPSFRRKSLPNSTNPMENFISYLNKRLKTLKEFKTVESAKRTLRLIIVKYRFKTLKSSENRRKRKNSPLELSGARIRGLNYLTFIQKSDA